mmetsp:Transcript_16099/g.24057  ORF Transcript_16099/g.24057 Transcript_16099/m.24057 type:complete len:244 (-) Transcript_16099:90-821(-)
MGNKSSKSKSKSTKDITQIDPEVAKDLQVKYGLDNVKLEQFSEVFQQVADKTGELNEEQFQQGLKKMETLGLKLANTPFSSRLFRMLDKDNSGSIDVAEFISGMAVIVQGNQEDKLKLTFKAYDANGDGYIDQDELQVMFKSAWLSGFQFLRESHDIDEADGNKQEVEDFSNDLAAKFAKQAFLTLDKDKDGKLTFEEFMKFAAQDPKITTTLNGFQAETRVSLVGVGGQAASSSSSQKPPST